MNHRMRNPIESLIIDGILFGNPVLLMALDREDEIVYRLVGLAADVPYAPIRMTIREGKTMPNRSDEENRLIRSVANACHDMLNRTDHPFGIGDGRRYATRLGTVFPECPIISPDSFDLLRGLWDTNPILAAICCNHQLIHDKQGVFAPESEARPLLEHVLKTGDRGTFEDALIRRTPGMLSARGERRLFADA